MPQLAANIEAPDEVQHRALELAQVAAKTDVANGCRPSGVAAACLDRAGGERGGPVSRAVVAEAANVTQVTVRVRDEALGEALSD